MTGPRILIVGGGYVGLYAALQLQKTLDRTHAQITVVEPNDYMTYAPFLPEAAAGSLDPRHVVVPLHQTLKKCKVIAGRVTAINHAKQRVDVEPIEGGGYSLEYDQLIVAGGSVARTMAIPGLAEVGIGLKSVHEAEYLRNRVLSRLVAASSTKEQAHRDKALTFLVIGGGFAGIETLAELEDLAKDACKTYPNINRADMRWILVEGSGRVLPEVSESMGQYTLRQLAKRGIEVRLNTFVNSLSDGHVILSDGTEFCAGTVVWTAGVKANPLIASTDLPHDAQGRLTVDATLRAQGLTNVWSGGDCAAVPDLSKPEGAFCSPSAQHAVRQAKLLGANLSRQILGKPLKAYRHKYVGSVASLGLYKGVADLYGIKLKGFPAWWIHRTYHVSRMPTFERKVRIIANWTIALFFRREIAALGQVQDPRAAFRDAALATVVATSPKIPVARKPRTTKRVKL